MMENLRQHFDSDKLARMQTFRADIRHVETANLPKVDLALIDGEHTDVACFSDADRVLDFVKDDSIIVFHDANLVANAIQNFERMLTRLGITYTTVFLPDVVGAIGIGTFADSIRQEFEKTSFPRNQYFSSSQLQRWVAVGQSMQERGLISKADADAERMIANLQEQVASIELEAARRDENSMALSKSLDDANSRIRSLLESTSWKISAPLRAIGKLVGR